MAYVKHMVITSMVSVGSALLETHMSFPHLGLGPAHDESGASDGHLLLGHAPSN